MTRILPKTTSVTDLVSQAEERDVLSRFEQARNTDVSLDEVITGLLAMSRSKAWWLRQHGVNRPKGELAKQEHNLAVLLRAADHFKLKQERENASNRDQRA